MPAASAKGIRAGKAFVELFADDSKVIKALDNTKKRFMGWAKSVAATGAGISAAGGAMAAPLLAAAGSFVATAKELALMSDRSRASTESLSQLGYAAEQSGASLQDVAGGLAGLQALNAGLMANSDDARLALNQLGVSAADLMSRSPEQQFLLMAEAVRRVRDPIRQATLANQVFGGSAEALLPLLRKGAGGIAELMRKADALGVTMGRDDAQAAVLFSNALGSLTAAAKAVVNTVGAVLTPMLTAVVGRVVPIVAGVRTWIDANRGLVRMLGFVAAGLLLTGAAVTAVAGVLVGLGTAAGVVASALGVVGSILSALLSPIGLILAAVAGLAVGFVTYLGGIGAAMNWLKDQFAPLIEVVSETFDTMKAAMAAGDFQTAANVLWAGLKMVWAQGVAYLNGLWVRFRAAFGEIWSAAVTSVSKAWVETTSFISDAWSTAISAIGGAWDAFVSGMKTGFASASNWVADKMLGVMAKFDPSINLEDARGELAAMHKQELAGIEAARKAKDKARQDAQNKEIGESEAKRNAALGEIDAQAKRDAEQRGQAFTGDLAESEKKLADAKAEWQKTMQAAKAAGKAKPGGKADPANPLAGLLDGLKGGGAALASGPQTGGTFSGAAGRMFGAGPGNEMRDLARKQVGLLDAIKGNTASQAGAPGAAPRGVFG